MIKQILTLARGRSADATQAVLDANALSILRQQMREAAAGVEQSRKALAVVMAYSDREKGSLAKLDTRIEDLEGRAIAALSQGQEALAHEAAGAIAGLEAERRSTTQAIDMYGSDISRLRQILRDSEAQLAEMKRGQRLAQANDATLRLRGSLPDMGRSDLADAAATLKRLQDRQDHAAATAKAMADLSASRSADAVSDRLTAAGCGAPKHSDAEAVLARLKAQAS